MLDRAVEARFLRAETRATMLADAEPAALLDALAAWRPRGAAAVAQNQIDAPEAAC